MKIHCVLLSIPVPVFMLFLFHGSVLAQDDASDSNFIEKALSNTRGVYHQAFRGQSALYNGSKYGEYIFRFNEGHPFYSSVLPAAGYVVYDGVRYDSVLMRYDEVADVLVINSGTDRIKLHGERVSSFHVYGADFIRMEKDSSTDALAGPGFYNKLYHGKSSLLMKEVKTIREVISTGNELQHLVDTKDFYYVQMGQKIYAVKSKKDLYRLFGDRRKAVQQFVKQSGLNFRHDRRTMLVQATAYYDGLNK